jgi:hypothetical protein
VKLAPASFFFWKVCAFACLCLGLCPIEAMCFGSVIVLRPKNEEKMSCYFEGLDDVDGRTIKIAHYYLFQCADSQGRWDTVENGKDCLVFQHRQTRLTIRPINESLFPLCLSYG